MAAAAITGIQAAMYLGFGVAHLAVLRGLAKTGLAQTNVLARDRRALPQSSHTLARMAIRAGHINVFSLQMKLRLLVVKTDQPVASIMAGNTACAKRSHVLR